MVTHEYDEDYGTDSPSGPIRADDPTPGTQVFQQREKVSFQVPDIPEIDCKTYEEILVKIKALNTTDEEKILEMLGDLQIREGLKLRDIIMHGSMPREINN